MTTEELLQSHGIRPTVNRILVLRQLGGSDCPQSLSDLETAIETLDKSSISRTLAIFQGHGLVHVIEDGRGVSHYELCHCPEDEDNHTHDDLHPHFYCENCHRVICLEDTELPHVPLPPGFTPRRVNYMISGTCDKCNNK